MWDAMSLGWILDKDRQVIPRWHTFSVARWLGVLTSTRTSTDTRATVETFNERILDWRENGKLFHAADLVGNALALNYLGDVDAVKAAEFIIQHKNESTKLLLETAESYLLLSNKQSFPIPDVIVPEEVENFYRAISSLKKRATAYPRSPILWIDLAFYYCAIGQTKEAARSVTIALSLNKENRYLLRSASRFFMHLNKPDTALHFLRQSNIGLRDPWLIAAEIAISDTIESPSKRVKAAKSLIESGSVSDFHLSEMAGALGTIELRNGARKRGRKLFGLALSEPTENTLAQAAFLKDELGDLLSMVTPENVAHPFEAATRTKFWDHDFEGALEQAKSWFAYQPFSSRPAVVGSYIAAVALRRFDQAIKIARMGLLSSPKDVVLRNNLAFSLASLGETAKAKQALTQIIESQATDQEATTLFATKALIKFREGDLEGGRMLYRNAVDSFRKQRDHRGEALAKFFWAREEKLIKSKTANTLEEEALTSAKKLNIIELLSAADKKEGQE